ncbi:MAG: hypothetical protein AAGB18_07495 [Pseudomonadota bacterium]
MEQFISLWPLAVVIGLAIQFVRLGRMPRRNNIRGSGNHAQDGTRTQSRKDNHESFDSGAGSDGGGGD